MEILIPVIILGAIAAIFAIVLAIAGKKLAVIKDEREEKVLNLLPGANCGACGKAGCAAFAKALVEGDAKVTDCTSSTKEAKEKISEILGSELGAVEETIVVNACGGGYRCKDKYTYQGYGDCASIELLAGGRKACVTGCIGAGTCVDVCPYHAVEIKGDGVAVVNQEKCVQCGTCILACPKNLMTRLPAKAKIYIACSNHDRGKDVRSVCEVGCIACGLCAKVCPNDAITMVDNLPIIDYNKCTACGKCVEKCPSKCILYVNPPKN